MALAIDGSTPAIATGNTASVTTASFTPPNGAVVLLALAANSGTVGADVSFSSVTNTGTAITWTRQVRKNKNAASLGGAGTEGGVEFWTGVGTGGAITVTATNSQAGAGAGEKSIQAVVLTGADTSALTSVAAAFSASGLPSVALAGGLAGSYVFASSSDWAQKGLGTAGTAQTIISEFNVTGNVTTHHWRTTSTLASAGSQTMNLTAPTAQNYNLVVIEVRIPATSTAPPPQPVARRRAWPPRRQPRAGQVAPVQVVVVTTQALPPQPARQARTWLPRKRPRASQPVPLQVVVQTVQALPPQPTRRPQRLPIIGRYRATQGVVVTVQAPLSQPVRRPRPTPPPARHRAAQPVPAAAIVVTAQALPPQPGRRPPRLLVLPRSRVAQLVPAAAVVVTVQALPPQPTRRPSWPSLRARPRVSQPPLTVTVALPLQQVHRRVWAPVRRRVSAQPVLAPVVVVTIQPLPPQPMRRPPRLALTPRHGVVQPVFPVTVVVTAQTLPPQPTRRLLRPPLARHARIAVPLAVTVALPPPAARRRAWLPTARRARRAQPVPAQIIVVTAQVLPSQPTRRLRWLPQRRRNRLGQPVLPPGAAPTAPPINIHGHDVALAGGVVIEIAPGLLGDVDHESASGAVVYTPPPTMLGGVT